MLGYLSADICSEKRTVRTRKTVSSEELIMSKNKYPSIFSKLNEGYCVYYPSNIFRNTHLEIITGYSPVFGHVMRLDQSHASENV